MKEILHKALWVQFFKADFPGRFHELEAAFESFWECKSLHDQVDKLLEMLDLIDIAKQSNIENASLQERLGKLEEDIHEFLKVAFNAAAISPELRDRVKKLRGIDGTYLPNHLPFFISEPNPDRDNKKTFIKSRLRQVFTALGKGLLLNLIPQKRNERLIKANIALLKAYKHYKKTKPADQPNPIGEKAKNNAKQNNKEREKEDAQYAGWVKNKIEYLAPSKRAPYQTHVSAGKYYKSTIKNECIVIDAASTSGNISHSKPGWAAFVCTHKGEEFQATHINSRFMHSSFVAGAPVFFSGEREIDENGVLLGLTRHSGHYRPTKEQFQKYVFYLYNQGVDLSQCVVYEQNDTKTAHHIRSLAQGGNETAVALLEKGRYSTEDENLFYEVNIQYDRYSAWDFIKDKFGSKKLATEFKKHEDELTKLRNKSYSKLNSNVAADKSLRNDLIQGVISDLYCKVLAGYMSISGKDSMRYLYACALAPESEVKQFLSRVFFSLKVSFDPSQVTDFIAKFSEHIRSELEKDLSNQKKIVWPDATRRKNLFNAALEASLQEASACIQPNYAHLYKKMAAIFTWNALHATQSGKKSVFTQLQNLPFFKFDVGPGINREVRAVKKKAARELRQQLGELSSSASMGYEKVDTALTVLQQAFISVLTARIKNGKYTEAYRESTENWDGSLEYWDIPECFAAIKSGDFEKQLIQMTKELINFLSDFEKLCGKSTKIDSLLKKASNLYHALDTDVHKLSAIDCKEIQEGSRELKFNEDGSSIDAIAKAELEPAAALRKSM